MIPNKATNPFPGLRAFRQEEDYLFFGREEQTIALLQRLGGNRFVAVVGTSGSGKSSLVRCGLLSELLGGKLLQAGASWEVAVTHPGGNPLALLTDALLEADLYDTEEENVRENLLATLSRSHFGLVEAVRQADLGEDTNFLLVVDQFEEIFRFREAGQRQQEAAAEFISLLLETVAQSEVPIYVVLTMRSDFIGECSQFDGLAEAVNRGEFLIPRLTREQYKRVIEGPVKVAGGKIAPRLLQRLLNDLGQQADQLPCLQHALMRTWDVWAAAGETEALDLDDYQRVGKMAEALSLHADEVYGSLAGDREREWCRGIFEALTVKESENRGIRRPQRLSSLSEILEVPVAQLIPIIDTFRQHGVTFLMPAPEVDLTGEMIIDISHESLMRVWTRLRHWVEEEAQAVGIYRRLAENATLHDQGKAGLYRDPELGIALAWLGRARHANAAWAERYRPGFAGAMAFLQESKQAAEAEEREREAARQRELEQAKALAEAQKLRVEEQKRSAKRLRWLVAASVSAAVLAFLAFLQSQRAETRAETARSEAESSRDVARTAQRSLNTTLVLSDFDRGSQAIEAGNPGEGLPFLAQAMRRDPSFWQAGMTALSALTHESFVTEEVHILRQENPIATWGFSAESGLAWSREEKGPLGFVWDLKTGANLYPLGDGKRAEDPRFSRDGARLFAVVDGAVHGWDARTGTSLGYAVESGGNANRQWIGTAEGEGFFGMSDAQGLKVFRTAVGKEVTLAPVDGVVAAWPVWAFTPDGEKICALHQDGALAIWSTRDGALVRRIATSADQGGKLHLSPDASLVMAGARQSQTFNWWSIDGGDDDGAATEPVAFDRPVSNARWLKANNTIVFHTAPAENASDRTHEIAVYDPATRVKVTGFSVADVTHGPVFAGDRFAVVAFVVGGNTVVVKDLATAQEITTFVSADEILELEFRHDGRRVFGKSGSDAEGLLHLWDVYTGREVSAPMRVALPKDPRHWQSPEGRRLFVHELSSVKSFGLWDSESGRRLAQPFTPPSAGGEGYEPGFLRDGVQGVARWLTRFTGSEGLTVGELVVWNADSSTAVLPEPLRDLSSGGDVRQAKFSRDGRRVLVVGRENADVPATRMHFCDVWDTESRQLLFRYRQHEILHGADLDPTGERVAIAHPEQLRVSVWNIASGREVRSLPQDGSESTNFTRDVKFSPDGKRLLTLGFDASNSLHLWDLATGEPVFPPAELTKAVREFHFEDDQIHLVTEHRYLQIDAETGQTVAEHRSSEEDIWVAAISPDFTHLAFSAEPPNEEEVRIIDTAPGERLNTLQHDDTIRNVQFSPDGNLVAASTGKNFVVPTGAAYLWDWRTGKQTVPPMDMRGFVDGVRFSPDGSLLAATTRLNGKEALYLWDVRTGRPLMESITLGVESTDPPANTEIAFRPDGRQLLVAADKGAIRLIDLPPRDVPIPDFVPRVAEAVAGARRVDGSLGAEPVDRGELQALRKEILASDATDGYTRWAQWILADRATRTVAPGDPRTRSEYLNQLLHRGDEQALHEALLLAPDHALAHARMGYALATSPELDKETDAPHRQHWMDSAQWYLDRALELDDANAEVWACQAEVHLRRGESEAARKAAERAIELATESPNANYLLAATLAEAGHWEQAGEAFQKALAPLTAGPGPDTKTATPLLGLLEKLKVEETWAGRRDVTLPEPIAGAFEDFEAVAEGALPPGWQAENHTDDSTGAGRRDLGDANSDAYKDWVVVSRERVLDFARGEADAPAGVRLGVRPNQFLNGAPVRRLLDGKLLTAESNSREGAQFQVLVTPDFDCGAQSGVHVAFHGAGQQNQDSLTALEYSVDSGQSWLPVVYRLDGNDVVRDKTLAIDAVATFTQKHEDAPRYRGSDGQWVGEAYGDFIAAKIAPELAPFIEPGLDDDETEFQQVEVFRLPEADGKATVRLRFAHAGSDSRYWSLDNFGLYAIPESTPVLEQAPSQITASPVAPAADPDRLLALATGLLENEKTSPRDALEARLLAQQAIDLLPRDPQVLAVYALALGRTGAVEEAIAAIERATALRPDFAPFRKTQALIYGMQGEQLLAGEKKAEAALSLEIADTLLRSLEATPDQAVLDRAGKSLVAVGRVREPQVILPRGSFWKFLDDGSDQETAWSAPGFDDAAWRGGPARIGYDDGSKSGEVTAVKTRVDFGPDPANKHITTYLRTTFEFTDPGRPQSLSLSLQRDDGAVIYLNGKEIGRSNMPTGPVRFDTTASSALGVADEGRFVDLQAPASALRPGRNLVAVELHQANRTSSDLGFDLEIAAGGIDLASYPTTAELAALEESLRVPAEIRSLLWVKRAEVFLGAGDEPRGEECLQQALTIDPEDPTVPYMRAKIAAEAKDEAASDAAYRTAVELAMRTRPASSRGLLLPGALHTLAKVDENSPLAMAREAARLQENGGDDWEVAALDRLLAERAPDVLAVKPIRVGLLIGLGRHEQALSLIDALLAGNPGPQWTIIEPTRIESEGGESFTFQDDGSILVGGENPKRSVYRMTLPAAGGAVTGLRLEVLRNPDGASGRHDNGHALIAEFRVNIHSNETGNDERIPVLRAWGMQEGRDAHAAAIDGDPQSHWAIYRPQSCFFELATPLTPQGDAHIQVTIDSGTGFQRHGLACFRLSVTGTADPVLAPQLPQQLLRQKETCYRALGRIEEADAVRQAALSLPRPAGLDPKLLDLSDYYNGSLVDGSNWGNSDSNNNLSGLAEGVAPRKGVAFDARGVIGLTATPGTEVTGIAVGQPTSAMHILSSMVLGREAADGAVVARLLMHYADGTTETMEIHKGPDGVQDWWRSAGGNRLTPATIGWEGRNDANADLVLSELVWKNPHPDKVIASIDFVRSGASGNFRPFLVAITLE